MKMPIVREFLPHFKKQEPVYSDETIRCIEATVLSLEHKKTSDDRPGMLLGKIQSGKTRTFIGIMALAFDKGFDVAIILTKNTKLLASQTTARLKEEFKAFIDDDLIEVNDIMKDLNEKKIYTPGVLKKKHIFIAKKQVQNIAKLRERLIIKTPEFAQKRFLFIDDEADFTTVTYQTRDARLEFGRVSNAISELRECLKSSSYLQVTATPYSLYLQPENIEINGERFKPVKPSFTHLVPTHPFYVGGEYYFEESQDLNSPASDLHLGISEEEIDALENIDRRHLNNVWTTDHLHGLRNALLNFLVGVAIRRIQAEKAGVRQKKYGFLIHTATGKSKHNWQEQLILSFWEHLQSAFKNKFDEEFKPLIKITYEELTNTIKKANLWFSSKSQYSEQLKNEPMILPDFDEVLQKTGEILPEKSVSIINSDNQITMLSDEKGQLRLDNYMNVFIGGQVLDRGITIDNLIGFFYGRNPKKFQLDTVLQHSRMYGNRSAQDLAVTRFYTTLRIHQTMSKMNDFDKALRIGFENGTNQEVVFIQADESGIIRPCSPNKLRLSTVISTRPGSRMLPFGFQTHPATRMKKMMSVLDQKINLLTSGAKEPKLVEITPLIEILEDINNTFEDWAPGLDWNIKSVIANFRFLAGHQNTNNKEFNAWFIVRTDRDIVRYRPSGRLSDMPLSEGDATLATNTAKTFPVLFLLRQNGKKDNGWRDTPFWWPVIIAQTNIEPVIFAEPEEEASDLTIDSSEGE